METYLHFARISAVLIITMSKRNVTKRRSASNGTLPFADWNQAIAPNEASSVRSGVLGLTFEVLCVSLILLVLVRPVIAAKHPVPLAANVDAAKCLECHADKTKGKAVHSAMKMGCLSCHEVRVSKDSTHVKLTTATPSGLCFTCHADKNPSDIMGKIHSPGVRDCLKCHDPHSTANKGELLKPTSGDKAENLCLSCHDIGANIPKGGSRHAALDTGCDACHIIHKSGNPGQKEFAYHLSKPAPQLCLDCHDVNAQDLRKAHQNQPFAGSDCLQCHDPHESRSPKLMQAFLHNPFENKMCDSCHQPAKDGKVVLTAADSKAVCVTCHEEQAKQIASAKVQHPGAQGNCTDCHNPHAGKALGFLQPDPVAACLTCHSVQAAEFKKKHLHQPAFEQACGICHVAHGNDNPKLLRVADVNTLCLECHGPDSPEPQKLQSEHLITIFDGKVKLPEDYFKNISILPLKYGTGHPTEGHPVSTTVDHKTMKAIPLDCLSCHQPHASANGGLLVKDQQANMAFCRTCHNEGQLQLR